MTNNHMQYKTYQHENIKMTEYQDKMILIIVYIRLYMTNSHIGNLMIIKALFYENHISHV